jgi:capsular exopolysaccharide synthesis family protein
LYEPRSAIAEAFRTLRSNIQFVGVHKKLRVLLMTSAGAGEGKTSTVLNLAIVMAQARQKVLIIDADMRKPQVHERMLMPGEPGLSNLLIGQVEQREAIHFAEEAQLDVMPSGPPPPNPAELLNTPRLEEVLQQARQEYDYVLVDSPPLLPVTDAQVLSRHADGTLLVVDSRKALEENIRRAKSLLDLAGANLMGFVVNNKKTAEKDNYYYA